MRDLREFLRRHSYKRYISKKYSISNRYSTTKSFGTALTNTIRESCLKEDLPVLVPFSSSNGFISGVVGGVYGTKQRVKSILGGENLSDLECVKLFNTACSEKPSGLFSTIDHCVGKNAPCQEVVVDNLTDLESIHDILPVVHHDKRDRGPFITAGVVIMKYLDGKTHGLGIHRIAVNFLNGRGNVISVLAPPNRRVGIPRYASKEPVHFAVAIGAPPSVVLASQAKIPFYRTKYDVAANILSMSDSPSTLSLVRCMGSDVMVPAFSEIILECTTLPSKTFSDVPFLEYTGTYSMRSNAWCATINRITMRKNALYQTIVTGRMPQEDGMLCAIPYAEHIYDVARKYVSEITDISVFFGNCVFDSVLCVKKESDQQIQNLIHAALATKYVKSVSVMDSDLKANEEDWRFAFNTRFQPGRDVVITNAMLGASLDPSSDVFQTTTKIGLDLTIPTGSNVLKYQRGGY